MHCHNWGDADGRALGAVLPAGRRQLLLAPAERQPASREDLQLVRDLAFVTRLTNPCQLSVVARARSPPGARQHWQPDQRRAEELAIELHRASTLAAELRQVAGVPDCSGLKLDSQRRIQSLSGLPRHHALLELYRGSLYEAAHLNLIVDEIAKSHQTCGNRSLRLIDQMFMLSGSLQNIMCVISETLPEEMLQPMMQQVGDITLHRYHVCSRRLMRNCLVLESTSRMLAMAMEYVHESQLAESGLLPLRVARAI